MQMSGTGTYLIYYQHIGLKIIIWKSNVQDNENKALFLKVKVFCRPVQLTFDYRLRLRLRKTKRTS